MVKRQSRHSRSSFLRLSSLQNLMDKVNKALETLKGPSKKKESSVPHKDKIALCQQLAEGIQNSIVKKSADYGKVFSSSFETLFSLCDDLHSDVRIVAEESLNVVIRNSFAEGNATRVHIELFKEIRRNGAARCLRSALTKFADLADQIRPQKCRMFAVSLVPCLAAVARRPEDSIYESFGVATTKIFAALGQFFSEEESKILIKSVLPNLQLASAPARRAASTFLVELCRNSRKKYLFTAYLFKGLLETIIPVQLDQSVQQLLGTLTALRSMTSLIKECDDNDVGEIRFVQAGVIRVNPQISITLDQLLQFFEVLLYYVCYPNSSVTTCVLETLSSLLQNLPRRLIKALQSKKSIEKSRIFSTNYSLALDSKSSKTLSGFGSGFSSVGGSQTDLSVAVGILIENDDNSLFPEVPSTETLVVVPNSNAKESSSDVDLKELETVRADRAIFETFDDNYTAIVMGEIIDEGETETLWGSSAEQSSSVDEINYENVTIAPKNKRLLELSTSVGNSKPCVPEVPTFSEPSTPLSPENQGIVVEFPSDIGSFVDEEIPLKYCCRLLCLKFLLSGEIGVLIPDKDVRVSQKVLALNCVHSLISLDPYLIFLPLYCGKESDYLIKDVFLYSTHSDHLIRGEAACMAGSWLKAEFISSRCGFHSNASNLVFSMRDLIEEVLIDQHFLAARSAIIALTNCHNEILSWQELEFSMHSLKTLNTALSTLRHKYWTVKLSLLELWSTLNFGIVRQSELYSDLNNLSTSGDSYQSKVLQAIAEDLLGDENGRVRQEAGNTLCNLVKSLCFVDHWDDTKFIRCIEPSSKTIFDFSWYHDPFSKIHNLSAPYDQLHPKQLMSWQEENLSFLVDLLFRTMSASKDQFHLSGCLSALSKLSDFYPPTQYFNCWSTFVGENDSGVAQLVALLQILNTVTGTEAINVHQVLLNLLGNLFAGFASRQLEKQTQPSTSHHRWPLLTSQALSEFASDLTILCLRILSVYWHVSTETTPLAPPMITKPPMPQLGQQTLTPVAQKIKAVATSKLDSTKVVEKTEPPAPTPMSTTKTKVGDFYNLYSFMRLHEMVKGGYTNYKTSLDIDVTERFVGLLRSCLRCLSVLLEVATLTDIEKFSEEILVYAKPLMTILPSDIVLMVTQNVFLLYVLKALFGTNLSLCIRSDSSNAAFGVPLSSNVSYSSVFNAPFTLYQSCVVKPRAKFAQAMAASNARHDLLNESFVKHLGWFGSRADKYVVNLLKKPAHKTILTSYIRLFEPIVVQALRFYTSSFGTDLQRSVICLLVQLVQIRVNYCLLDSDQKFLNFLFQQLENVDDGILSNAHDLVKSLFEFFIVLSYEKYQNKSVLEVPKILQLVDSLLASGLNENLGISALHSVVLDLFLLRPAAKLESPKELEIQQECVISVLMKSINCVETLDLFTFIFYRTRRENEAKWRKLSRDVVDVLVPLLAKGQFPFVDFESFRAVVNFLDFLCSGAFRPIDSMLELLFNKPTSVCNEYDRFCKWLCVQYVCLHAMVLHCKEDAILSRLEMSLLSLQFGATSCALQRAGLPTVVNNEHFSTPQDSFACVLLTVCDLALNELSHYSSSLPPVENSFLEKLALRYLQLLTHICQSGAFRKVSASMSALISNKWTTCVLNLSKFSPQIVVQFFYLLSSLHVYDDRFWSEIISKKNFFNPILQNVVRILYADHVKAQVLSGVVSSVSNTWKIRNAITLIEEPPVNELITIFHRNQEISRLYLEEVEKYLKHTNIPPRKVVNILRSLDSIHVSLSVDALHYLVRCLECPFVAVRQTAALVACRKVEIILINRNVSENTHFSLRDERFVEIVCILQKPVLKNFEHLRSLVKKLVDDCLPLNEENDVDYLSTLSSAGQKMKKPKYIQLIQSMIQLRCVDGKRIAQLLKSLSMDEISELLSDWNVTGEILEACLMSHSNYSLKVDSSLSSADCEESINIAPAAVRALLAGIRTILLKVSKDVQFICSSNSYSFSNHIFDISTAERLLDYVGAARILISNGCLMKTLNESDLQVLTKFSYLASLVTLQTSENVSIVQLLDVCHLLVACFVNNQISSVLNSNEFSKNQADLIGFAFWTLIKNDSRSIYWMYVRRMLIWLAKKKTRFNDKSNELLSTAKKLIIGVARLPFVCSFSRVPVSVYNYGWIPEIKRLEDERIVLPTTPVRFLQNVDSLHDFAFLVNLLGWSSRQDFEEIWMGLLGVLSATPIGQELHGNSQQEIADRVCASTVAVRCLTSLLLQTLLYPVPGNPLLRQYVSKQRDKQSTFLKSTSGQRLLELRRIIDSDIPVSSDCLFQRFSNVAQSSSRNVERLHNFYDYSFSQFSIDTLWSLTGILAEEESLLTSTTSTSASKEVVKPEIVIESVSQTAAGVASDNRAGSEERASFDGNIPRSTSNYVLSAETDINMSSCLHFLLDLFGHWLSNGADAVPLPLLSATIESVVLLSDLFTERVQYEWLREKLLAISQVRSVDDELIMQDLALGILKSSAVLGMNDTEKEKETLSFVDSGLKHIQLSVRISTLQGALYVLQTLTSDEIVGLMPVLADYILTHLTVYANFDADKLILEKPQCVDHQLVLWAVGYFIAENFHDPHTKGTFAPKFLEICMKVLNNRAMPVVFLKSVVCGIQSLLVNSSMDVKTLGALTKISTDSIQNVDSSEIVKTSVELLLVCLYSAKENRRSDELTSPESEMAPRSVGEPSLLAMERLAVLLNRISKGNLDEASLIGNILPTFLDDNFSPGDVMNKIITELLHPAQAHPQIILRILYSLIESLLRHEATSVVCEWILLSIPTFTHKNPWHFAVWCLSCLFLSVSPNRFVKNLSVITQYRADHLETFDISLFTLSVETFCAQLQEKSQLESFLLAMTDAYKRNKAATYGRATEIVAERYATLWPGGNVLNC